MEDGNIITVNPANWITIVLMVAIAFSAFGFVQSWWAGKNKDNG